MQRYYQTIQSIKTFDEGQRELVHRVTLILQRNCYDTRYPYH